MKGYMENEVERERFAAGTPEHRDERIEIRCSDETKRLAKRLAKKRGVTVSELFRTLVEGAK